MLLSALLVWLALDFCTPDIPGAFVFDSDGSIDGIDARARVAPKTVVLSPVVPKASFDSLEQTQSEPIDLLPQRSGGVPPGHVTVSCLARATCASALSSEDSH